MARRRGGQTRASTSCASISDARSGTSSANSRTAGSLRVGSARRVQRSGSNSCFSTSARTSSGEKDTTRALYLSARGSRNSRWRCSARSRRLRSARNNTPPAALASSSEGGSASISAPATNGAPAGTKSRANSSGRMPRSPRSISGAASWASCARRFFASASTPERPSAARVARAFGERHLVALVFENLRKELADADFVVDDEDLCHRLGGLRERQQHGDRGAARRLVLDRHAAVVLIDDLLHNRQSEPRAARLGGDVGLENTRHQFLRKAAAV